MQRLERMDLRDRRGGAASPSLMQHHASCQCTPADSNTVQQACCLPQQHVTDFHCLQVNLALKGLPKFRCLPEAKGQHRTTTHLLPDEHHVIKSLSQGFADVQAGRLPDFPTIEWYFHTTNDPSVQVGKGAESSLGAVHFSAAASGYAAGNTTSCAWHDVTAMHQTQTACFAASKPPIPANCLGAAASVLLGMELVTMANSLYGTGGTDMRVLGLLRQSVQADHMSLPLVVYNVTGFTTDYIPYHWKGVDVSNSG